MGLFNFTKQNTDTAPEAKAPEVRTIAPPPVPAVVPARTDYKRGRINDTTSGKNHKDDINAFFNINIQNIFKHKPEPTGSQEYAKGRRAEIFLLKLNPLELATFNEVYIIRYENSLYDLAFRSVISEVKPELQEFLAFCETKYGPDFMGKGKFTDADVSDLNLGAMSRLWMNKIRIDNVYMHINLTLYDIQPDKHP
jgi:hypothetical protein